MLQIFFLIKNRFAYFRYCLAVAILAFLYTMGQTALKFYESHKNKGMLPRKIASLLDFAGDQVDLNLSESMLYATMHSTDWYVIRSNIFVF